MTNNDSIEQEIKDKGLIAPRITLGQIESKIAAEFYVTGTQVDQVAAAVFCQPEYADSLKSLKCLTLCVLVLRNGFTVTGESKPVHNDNFDAGWGRKIARQNALDKVWMLEEYRLKQELYEKAAAPVFEEYSGTSFSQETVRNAIDNPGPYATEEGA